MKQLTLFDISIQEDPLYQQIIRLRNSPFQEIYVNGNAIRIERKKIGSKMPVFEYETEQEHGLAKSLDEIYQILKRIIDEQFNKPFV